MRLGVFGGSFDPVHLGHLALAAACRDQARLDRVLFVPAARQPLKPRGPTASDAERVAMLEAATKDHPEYEVLPIEIERGGTSFTVDTLQEIHRQRPAAELFLLMGEDALADFSQWREPREILELACPLVVGRATDADDLQSTSGVTRHHRQLDERIAAAFQPFASEARLREIGSLRIAMEPSPLSSSELRRRIAAGEEWQSLAPDGVAAFIRARRLYDAKGN